MTKHFGIDAVAAEFAATGLRYNLVPSLAGTHNDSIVFATGNRNLHIWVELVNIRGKRTRNRATHVRAYCTKWNEHSNNEAWKSPCFPLRGRSPRDIAQLLMSFVHMHLLAFGRYPKVARNLAKVNRIRD